MSVVTDISEDVCSVLLRGRGVQVEDVTVQAVRECCYCIS
jgi:hypothetical protein